jgi:hypothetical protein
MRLGRHGACRHEGDERQRGVMRTCTRKGDGALEAHGRLPSRQRRRSAETLGRKAEVDMVMACGRGRGAVLQFWGWVRFVWVRLLLVHEDHDGYWAVTWALGPFNADECSSSSRRRPDTRRHEHARLFFRCSSHHQHPAVSLLF